ncbi:MAG: multidrug efflux SMR transporter [Burkholderiales bacterium]|jgi:quaternary ammonium compound-resistance protein SugE|nr:multidrug efflux SMR transporter [Burkholderiales bacterium]
MTAISHPTTAWFVVLVSGLLEVIFSVGMKLSEGYSRPLPSLISVAAAILSVWLMSLTLKVIPLGTAYAIWAGIGAAGTALAGMLYFQEPASPARLACIALVVAGIVGLQWLESA